MKPENSYEIRLRIQLDENKIPQRITWKASDMDIQEEQECKAFLLSLWDAIDHSSLRMDLWTKDMRVDDMTRHFLQTLVTMSQTFERATHTKEITSEMKKFCDLLSAKIFEQFHATGKENLMQ